MRLLTTFFCALWFSTTFMFAQEEGHPNPNSIYYTKSWCVYPMGGNMQSMQAYYMVMGDVSINGKDYMRLMDLYSSESYVGALREDGHKVYFLPNGEKREYLLYDFGLELGESVDVGLNGESHVVTVVGIDSVYVLGVRRRLRIEDETIRDNHWSWPAYWIEGIGSDLGILSPYGWGSPDLKYRMYMISDYIPVSALFEEWRGSFNMLEGMPTWDFWADYATQETKTISFRVSREGDTVNIGNKSYQKLTMTVSALKGSTGATSGVETTMGIREENGRIYANYDDYIRFLKETKVGDPDYIPYQITDENEIVLYDYNMKEGDTFRHVDGHDDISVVSVSCAEGDNYRKKLMLSNGNIIEKGKGCTNSLGILVAYLNPAKEAPQNVTFTGYGKKGIYTNFITEQNRTSFTDEITTLKASLRQKTVEGVYDLQGRKVTIPQKKGLYIKNGKKFIAR